MGLWTAELTGLRSIRASRGRGGWGGKVVACSARMFHRT
jgi:hypothetical protein